MNHRVSAAKFVLLMFMCTIYGVVNAQNPPTTAHAPTSDELRELLAGHSNDGVWDGRAYRQYFSADGTTRYQEENSRPSAGRWRVNDTGQYCSIWPPSTRWTCYSLLVDGEDIYWKSGDKYFHARRITGNIFTP